MSLCLALAIACGQSTRGSTGGESSASTSGSGGSGATGNLATGGASSSDNGGSGVGATGTVGGGGVLGDNLTYDGWFEWTDDWGGAFIEESNADLSEDCSARLAASPLSAGLIYAHYTGTQAQRLFVEEFLPRSRPDLDPPAAPIYLLRNVPGMLSDSDAFVGYDRELVLWEPTGSSVLGAAITCETVRTRFGCYIPPEETQLVSYAYSHCFDSIEPTSGAGLRTQVDGTVVTVTNHREPCTGTDTLDETHPEEWPLGEQRLTFDIQNLEEGAVTEIPSGPFSWSTSYTTMEECSTTLDGPTFCDCEWAYQDAIEIERGWMLLSNGWVYIQVEGNADFPEYHYWDAVQL